MERGGEGSTEFLLSLFDDGGDGEDDLFDDEEFDMLPPTGSGGASSSSAAWIPPASAMPRLGEVAQKGSGKALWMDPLDCDSDMMDDDDLFLDDDDSLDDEFLDEEDFLDLSEEDRAKFLQMSDEERAKFLRIPEDAPECDKECELLEEHAPEPEQIHQEAQLPETHVPEPEQMHQEPQQPENHVPEPEQMHQQPPQPEKEAPEQQQMQQEPQEEPPPKPRKRRKSVACHGSSPKSPPPKVLKKQPRKTDKAPLGYPKKPQTAYGIFCGKRKSSAASSSAQSNLVVETQKNTNSADEHVAQDSNGSAPTRKGKGIEVLKEYRAAWNSLAMEERMEYEVHAAQDKQRFRDELETWLSQQPAGGLGVEAAEKELRASNRKSQKVPKSVAPRESAQIMMNPNSMAHVIAGAAALKPPPEPKPPPALQESGASDGNDASIPALAAPQEDDGDDFFAGFENIEEEIPAAAFPLTSAGSLGFNPSQCSGSLPTPLGAPAAFGPTFQDDDDDFGGDLDDEFSGDERAANNLPNPHICEEEYALANWQEPEELWPDMPETSGGPQVLAPQVRIDESGNIVLNASSLSKTMDDLQRPADRDGPAVEAVNHYKEAYKKTPVTKWSEEETARFYEALSLYGTDLFLVQTFFRNKSAAQIKSKYTRELKRNPKQVEEALTTRARKLTKDAFEKQHGPIDTSKHYAPQPTPEPGEEPEPDGSLPTQDAHAEPEMPEEPDYTEEDESLTTNRLMALFD